MSDSRRSDADIIATSLGKPEDFGEIFSRHHKAVFGFVARRIGSGDAGDVTAAIFERAFRIRGRYRPSQRDCRPWLYAIAVNILGDRLRRQRKDHRIYLAAPRALDSEDLSDDSDDRIVAEQIVSAVNRALGLLSMKDRETFLLYALEGLTYAEISEVLDVPIGTIGSRIFRVRARLLEEVPDLEQITGSEAPWDGE